MRRVVSFAVLALSGVAGAQELWDVGTPADSYGVYFMVSLNVAATGNRGIEHRENGQRVVFDAPMNVNSKQEKMVGRIDAKVSDTVFGDYACHLYSSTYAVQAPQGEKFRSFTRHTETWVDFKGVTRRVRTSYRDSSKTVDIDAVFGKDAIEMDMETNGSKRHLSLNPVQGVEAFSSPIPEMIKNAAKDRYEKVWCMIDATNGGIIPYTIRLKGRFVPPAGSSSKFKGWAFEVKAPVGIHTIFVTDEGQLRQIEFADTSVVRAVFSTPLGGG